jgi:CheY-like chemotaxis protein
MDIILKGGMNGIEIAAIINSIKPIPIIYLTALNDDESFLNAKNVSDFGYIITPFSEKIIDATIEKAVLKSRIENIQKFG